jgi:hypothetical protein
MTQSPTHNVRGPSWIAGHVAAHESCKWSGPPQCTLEMRAEGMPMTSPRLRTKRLDGFVKQWASSVWQRVFGEVLVIQL